MAAGMAENRGRPERRLAGAVLMLDSWLRRREGIFEYTRDPDCIFRLQHGTASGKHTLNDGTRVEPGDPILALHIWNEQVPQIPATGPSLAWALEVRWAVDRSLRLLAKHLAVNRADCEGINAIGADITLWPALRSGQLARVSGSFGFEPVADHRQANLLRRAGENILMLLLVTATNPAASRIDALWRHHTFAYLSRRLLKKRYTEKSGDPAPAGAYADR
jgi:hypothetical protein